jgi:uncharacterized membrane protein
MPNWAKIVVYPLGLAGFSLFILYKFSQTTSLPLWVIAAATFIALVGGLLLAYVERAPRLSRTTSTRRTSDNAETQRSQAIAKQISHGEQSPNIANVTGNATVNFGSSDTQSLPPKK